jgi:purine-cytosine permease-like protein
MTMATVVGDWSRYVLPARRGLLPVGLLAIAVSFITPEAVGAIVTTAFRDPYASFPATLVSAGPGWYAVLLLPAALVGGLGFSAATVYSTGLDLDSLSARLNRPAATIITGAASVALVLAGSILWHASDSLTAASLILLAVSAPWAAVLGADYLRRRGQYDADALQVWNRRETGGAYWYARGWNLPAVIAWAAGAAWGLLTVKTTLYAGPLAGIAGGVDVSLTSFAVAGVLYTAFLPFARPRTAPLPPARQAQA